MPERARAQATGMAVVCAAAFLLGTAGASRAEQAAPVDLKACVKDDGAFVTDKGAPLFLITITSTCPVAIRCTVNAAITTAMGATGGKRVVRLPAAKGAPVTRSARMAVKLAAGSANYARSCEAVKR